MAIPKFLTRPLFRLELTCESIALLVLLLSLYTATLTAVASGWSLTTARGGATPTTTPTPDQPHSSPIAIPTSPPQPELPPPAGIAALAATVLESVDARRSVAQAPAKRRRGSTAPATPRSVLTTTLSSADVTTKDLLDALQRHMTELTSTPSSHSVASLAAAVAGEPPAVGADVSRSYHYPAILEAALPSSGPEIVGLADKLTYLLLGGAADDGDMPPSPPGKGGTGPVDERDVASPVSPTSPRPFRVGVLGSSNAAGHDNNYTSSFVPHLRAGLNRILVPLGISPIVTSLAQGNTYSIPNAMCGPALLGDNPLDLLILEYWMNDAPFFKEQAEWYETAIRTALRAPGQPAILFVAVEGGRRTKREGDRPHRADMRRLQDSFYTVDPYRDLRDHYLDFSVNNLFMADALYPIDTRYPFRYEDLFATFHPGPAGHMFLSHAVEHYVAAAAAFSTARLADWLRAGMQVSELRDVFVAMAAEPLDLPPPLECEPDVCDAPVAHCATTFVPSLAAPLTDHLINATSFPDAQLPGGTWALTIPASVASHLHPELGLVDIKFVLQGDASSGFVHLAVRTSARSGIIFVCEPPAGWKRDEGWGSVRNDTLVQVDGHAVDLLQPSRHRLSQGPGFAAICTEVATQLAPGPHAVSIKVKATSSNYVQLSHIVGL